MNRSAFTLSLVIALIAIVMVQSYIEGREDDLKLKYGDPKQVIVAKVDIQEMDMIDDSKIMITTVPKNFVMPGAFTSTEEVYNTIAATPIKAGEQITSPRLVHPGARTGLARQISDGKRAVSVQISEQESVSKLLKPGDRIDIMSVFNYASGRMDMTKVKTVLQDVYVLATGRRVTREVPIAGIKVDQEIKKLNLNTYTDFNTVTLELTPDEAQKLIYLMKVGQGIYFTLRNNTDKTRERIGGTKLFDVLGPEDAAEAKAYFAEKQAQLERKR